MSAFAQVQKHLTAVGVNVDDPDEGGDEDITIGFRRVTKKD
jgi:hypothetical protein